MLYSSASPIFGKNLVLEIWANMLLGNQIGEFIKIAKKAENIFNNYWVGMVKNGLGLLGHGTLKSAVSQESYNELS